MSNFYRSILISNIRNLMEKHNIKQQELADILGMSQPNVNHNLNSNGKKCFTLEQLVGIADYFNISLDELVGRKTTEDRMRTPRAIGEYLALLLENQDAKIHPITITENVHEVDYGNNPPYTVGCIHENREVTYPAIYFPNYWQIPNGLSYLEEQELLAEISQCGNDTRMVPVNDFLTKFQQIFEVYENKGIDEDAFRIVVDNYLSRLRDK